MQTGGASLTQICIGRGSAQVIMAAGVLLAAGVLVWEVFPPQAARVSIIIVAKTALRIRFIFFSSFILSFNWSPS